METQSLKTTKTTVDTFLKAHVKHTSVILGEVVERGSSSVDMKSAVGRSECLPGAMGGRLSRYFIHSRVVHGTVNKKKHIFCSKLISSISL